MKYLFVISMGLLLTSCITSKKAYDYVVTDTFRNNDERALLSKAYQDEFPNYRDTPTVKTELDSTAYKNFLDNEQAMLDEIIKAYAVIDSLYALPRYNSDSSKVVIFPKCRFSPADSARAVKNFLAQRRPPPVEKNTASDTPIKNDGRLAEKEKELVDCRNENARLSGKEKEASDKLKDKNKTNTWLWVVVALLAAGNAYQLLNGKKMLQ